MLSLHQWPRLDMDPKLKQGKKKVSFMTFFNEVPSTAKLLGWRGMVLMCVYPQM